MEKKQEIMFIESMKIDLLNIKSQIQTAIYDIKKTELYNTIKQHQTLLYLEYTELSIRKATELLEQAQIDVNNKK